MNNRLKLFTAILLTITMAFTGSCVFAGTNAPSSEDGMQAALDVTGEAPVDEVAPAEEAMIPEAAAAPEEAVSAVTVMSEPEEFPEEELGGSVDAMVIDSIDATNVNNTPPANINLAWTQKSYTAKSDSETFHPIQVNVKTSGKLWIDVQRIDSGSYGARVVVGKNYNSSTQKMDYSNTTTGYVYAGDDPKRGLGGIDVVSGGNYYIGISSYDSGVLAVRAYVYPYTTRTLTVGKYMMATAKKTTSTGSLVDSNVLFRIKPSKTGFIRVYLKDYGYSKSWGDVTLLNSSKKAVSNKLHYYEGSSYDYVPFGVKKGATYYLKVTGVPSYTDLDVFGIKYKIYSATLRSISTKSKAKTLKRKASYISSALPATGKSCNQWYKFKVPKKQATQIRIDATNIKSGTVTATAYFGKKKIGTLTLTKGAINTLKITYSTTYGKAKKGTYYVKVTKSGKASGQYRIRYVK